MPTVSIHTNGLFKTEECVNDKQFTIANLNKENGKYQVPYKSLCENIHIYLVFYGSFLKMNEICFRPKNESREI